MSETKAKWMANLACDNAYSTTSQLADLARKQYPEMTNCYVSVLLNRAFNMGLVNRKETKVDTGTAGDPWTFIWF